ncbi:glycoside hydrolase family 28 protein [Saccharata proteae CBS 121410]|uniref:galacturonan 1,4-alpha-galacturonidase n=1 Tax=Saccharata proteae CBS 121410 TaxID=1314787 RepID=A0A9P4HMK7_9PEZI|nr:glycoside hydrolase family 28 protein [Saccharata proteae CBS 121410]
MFSLTSFIALSFLLPSVLAAGNVIQSSLNGRKQCTVYASGNLTNDVPIILQAFSDCGQGGDIIFPEDQDYYIASRLNPVFNDVRIFWQGQWTFSPDLVYWRNNSYPIAFQNHAASFIITGDHIYIDGYGTGGINGNGDAWYTAEAGDTQPGRPMPFVFWNVSDVTVKNFFVKQPPLWSLNIMNGTNMDFDNIYCNATATQAPYGSNWVQNTDGFDTMDAKNIRLTNFVYQGGDDCIAIKPRSYNIYVQNATCHGGNGMAIGSIGQYLEDSSVENVEVTDVTIVRYNEDMHNSAYIKTWVGALVPQSSYESAGLPRGGGWGSVRNILFANFDVYGADAGPAITQDSGDNGSYPGTSLMDVENVSFVNFTGYLNGKTTTASVSCSDVHPCYNIEFKNVDLKTASNSTSYGTGKCSYIESGGVHGLNGTGCN